MFEMVFDTGGVSGLYKPGLWMGVVWSFGEGVVVRRVVDGRVHRVVVAVAVGLVVNRVVVRAVVVVTCSSLWGPGDVAS